ncbi:MAG: rRNA maturation RNase YbeY [Holosporaceae bacterium]|jgi:probable rRNA maturation factor|nr:rRNA maturation RNase YbeY [Holosporaceae bacterium]
MNLEISVECDSWNEKEIKSIAAECVQAVFSEVGIKNDDIEVCFLFTNDEEMCILNKTYRGINKPTNVLSFPACDPFSEEESHCILGSIVLAFETIERESREQKKTLQNHLKHLITHGTLHLLRYDHVNEIEAQQMEELEEKILKKLSVKNPYEKD